MARGLDAGKLQIRRSAPGDEVMIYRTTICSRDLVANCDPAQAREWAAELIRIADAIDAAAKERENQP